MNDNHPPDVAELMEALHVPANDTYRHFPMAAFDALTATFEALMVAAYAHSMATEPELHDGVPAFPGMRVYCEWATWLTADGATKIDPVRANNRRAISELGEQLCALGGADAMNEALDRVCQAHPAEAYFIQSVADTCWEGMGSDTENGWDQDAIDEELALFPLEARPRRP
jgi:hypothetical protein